MKFMGWLLNNLGFLCLLVCLVLLGAQYILGSGADAVSVVGQQFGSGAVNNLFNPIFTSENEVVRFVVDNLIPCTIGSFCTMILGSILRKAAK